MLVIDIGSIQIRMHDEIVRTLTKVYDVPELKKNQVFMGIIEFLPMNGCERQSFRVLPNK